MTFEKKLILIIDDDETIKDGLHVLLENEGYDVQTLSSGHNLVEWLTHNTADLFLVDYLMPGMNGGDITRLLRSRANTSKTPIIMLAATKSYSIDGYASGINQFFSKPFEIDDLLAAIRRLIFL